MSKTAQPAFNVHTFSTAPSLLSDASYKPYVQNSQFSWSVAGPSSLSAQPVTPARSSSSVGTPSVPPVVLPPKRLPKKKQRTGEELEITRKTAERFTSLLAQDQSAVLQPDIDTPFFDHSDVLKRLLPYHIYQQPSEDLGFNIDRKGKQKATGIENLKTEIQETRFALTCHKRYNNLCERFRKAKIRTASRSAPGDQAYILAQAVLEADRLDASLLSNELKVARGELERLERDKRAATAQTPKTQYSTAPTMSTMQAQYYRPYPYSYTQAYGTTAPPPTTSTFQVNPSSPTNYYRPTGAIPVQLPVSSLPALHALGIHPVPASSVTDNQAAPPAVLRGSTANGTMLTLEINVSLLQSAQMSGLAMVLNSLMSRTGSAALPATSMTQGTSSSGTVSGNISASSSEIGSAQMQTSSSAAAPPTPSNQDPNIAKPG